MHYLIAYRVVDDPDDYDSDRPLSRIEVEIDECDNRGDIRDRKDELDERDDVREITARELQFDGIDHEEWGSSKQIIDENDFEEP